MAYLSNSVDPPNDILAGVRRASLTNIGQSLRITEHVNCLLQLLMVLGAHDHGGRLAVARHYDWLVLVFHPVDDLGEVVADISKRLSRHDHNGDAFGARDEPGVYGERRWRPA